jgi:hypothetical protein
VNLNRIAVQLQAFSEYPHLQTQIATVLKCLPETVHADFNDDPSFQITLENYSPEQGWKLFMTCPTLASPISRCVVLRRRLENATSEFAQYVIAHEFAHAYLRNGAWGDITDIEEAADALAANWGFIRPSSGWPT